MNGQFYCFIMLTRTRPPSGWVMEAVMTVKHS